METTTSFFNTKRLAITTIMLAICIASQFFKNLSVYITGPIVNLCIIITVMTAGLVWGLILCAITPVTAFFIAPSPVMMAVPLIILLIAMGNAILALFVHFLVKPSISDGKSLVSIRSVLFSLLSCIAKGCFMGLTIALWLLPSFIPEGSPLRDKIPVFQMTFSVTQFVTACIAFVLFFLIWKPVEKAFSA